MKNNQNEILKCEIRRKQMKTEKGGQPIKIRFSLAFKPFTGWGDSAAVQSTGCSFKGPVTGPSTHMKA